MNARKCDRCGMFYEEYNMINNKKAINGVMLLNIDSNDRYFSHGPNDLCPSCSKKFLDWFNGNSEIEEQEKEGETNG